MSFNKETHVAKPQEKPIRLQEYGVAIFSSIPTKSALKKALKKQLIFVNGKVATTATYIKGHEVITYHPSDEKTKHKTFDLKLEVLFEDNYLAIINKPAGVLVSGNSFKTIANALEQNLIPSSLPNATKPQPVHRLDYATTGLLLVGKTTTSIIALNTLFKNKKITKTYIAITIGNMKSVGIIDSKVDDKPARTAYEVVQTVISKRFEYLNFVKLYPETGRKHQLRKQLLELGNPILGDPTYYLNGLQLKGKGLYLHAHSLEFMHPITEELISVTKEPHQKYNKLFEEK